MLDGAGLDRWITGNYGEDQYAGVCEDEDCEDWDDCPNMHNSIDCEYDKRAAAAEARWELETGR